MIFGEAIVYAVAVAMVLDALLGEPEWLWSRLPHPAVLMGRAVAFADEKLNARTRMNGVTAIAGLLALAVFVGALFQMLPGIWAEVVIGGILLAQRSLVQHVKAVAQGLRVSVEEGRQAVAMIVGRDTRDMSAEDIARAAVESAAENFSDGVIAPLFWFVVAGLPGLIAYKMINTADSMIGYRTEKYENFGWAAARLDDVVNWVPARITAVLLWVVATDHAPLRTVRAEARQHRSPNAGWPEAVMAPALGIALAGPRSYEGQVQDYPWVNGRGRRDAGPMDIDRAIAALWRAWALALAYVVVIALL